jgi:hypothetical protein
VSVRRRVDPVTTPPDDLLIVSRVVGERTGMNGVPIIEQTFDVERWVPEHVAADDPWRATMAYTAWAAARAAWVATGGVWPDGEDQRALQEAIATPDEPFNWDKI